MYVTLYAADNKQIVLDAIKDTENAKLLFTNFYVFEGNQITVASNQITVASEVIDGLTKAVAEDLLSIIEYVHMFYPEEEKPDMAMPGCCALVVSVEPAPLHRDDYDKIVGMVQFETECGELNICVPDLDYVNLAHKLLDHMHKSVKAYIDDPRPMSEKLGEEIEKELENLK